MDKIKIYAVFMSILVILLPAKYAYSKTVILHNASETVTVRKGTKLVLNLDGNATTGYRWIARIKPENTNILKIKKGVYKPENSKLIGAGGTYTFVIKAMRKGEAQIIAEYNRSWEKVPIEVLEYTIIVK